MKAKRFDCVAMKRRGGLRVYRQTRNMTLQEQVAFWRKKTAELTRRIRLARRKVATGSSTGGKQTAAK